MSEEIRQLWQLKVERWGDNGFSLISKADASGLLDLLASKDAEIAQLTQERDEARIERSQTKSAFIEAEKDCDRLRALLLTQAQEVWEEAAKIADKCAQENEAAILRTHKRITLFDRAPGQRHLRQNAEQSLTELEAAKHEAVAIAAMIRDHRSRIPPSIGGDRLATARREAIRACLKAVEAHLPRGNGSEEIAELLGDIVWELRGLHGPFMDTEADQCQAS